MGEQEWMEREMRRGDIVSWRETQLPAAVRHDQAAAFRGGKTERQVERRHIHLALRAVAPGSCWKMKDCAALIRLHYRTSDYTRLTRVPKNEGKGKHT